MSRRGIFGIMLGGTAAYWFAVRGGMPLAAVDRGRNVALLKTKGGNLVAATQVGVPCPPCLPACLPSRLPSCWWAPLGLGWNEPHLLNLPSTRSPCLHHTHNYAHAGWPSPRWPLASQRLRTPSLHTHTGRRGARVHV